MPTVDVVVTSPVYQSARIAQLEAMFDVPAAERSTLEWKFEAPIETHPWSVGLIVGPSGAGKSTIARRVFGDDDLPRKWSDRSVIDDFDERCSMADIAEVCSAVGFNTIPSWRRPFGVLSNGEKFRVDLGRTMLEARLNGTMIVWDEFSSVVDREVAKIASYAVQKYIRRHNMQFVAVTCHEDVEAWLNPDWVIEPSTQTFRRLLQRSRPPINIEIGEVNRATWNRFAPFHYLTADLHRSARCFALWANGRLASFAGLMHRPISGGKDKGDTIIGVSRLVTLPDYQGLGLAFVLTDTLGGAYKATGKRLRVYPAHPSLVRGYEKSRAWKTIKTSSFSSRQGDKTSIGRSENMGGRPCAVFEYCGPLRDDFRHIIQ